jgi:hypothetical protein
VGEKVNPSAGGSTPDKTSEVLAYHFASVKARWTDGIAAFEKRIEAYAGGSKRKVIRTALYGDIEIENDELLLLDSFYMQRLRRVAQLGMQNIVYPDGRHTRFDHSIGVLTVTKQIMRSSTALRRVLGRLRCHELPHKKRIPVGDAACEAFGHSQTPLELLGRREVPRQWFLGKTLPSSSLPRGSATRCFRNRNLVFD